MTEFNVKFKDVTVVNQIEATASVAQEPGDAAVETTVAPTESGTLVHFAFSGIKGEPGFSPLAKAVQDGKDVRVTVQDKDGETTATVFAPVISTSKSGTRTTIKSDDTEIGYVNDGISSTITSTTVTYQASASGTMPPTGEWLDSPPKVAEGQYLWTKSYVLYSTGASYTAYSVGYHGEKGDVGPQGETGPRGDQGIQGEKGDTGADGISPTASVTQTSTGATVTVTDASGTTTAELTNGKDGVSPTIDTITDAQIDALFA